MALQNSNYNRVAKDILGASAGKFALMIALDTSVAKTISNIFIGYSSPGISPVAGMNDNYLCRVGIFSQQGNFPNVGTALAYSPSVVPNQDFIGDVGAIYFDHTIILPQNQQIFFQEPLFFNEGEKAFVVCSYLQKNGDSFLTPPNYVVSLSVNGRTQSSATRQLVFR